MTPEENALGNLPSTDDIYEIAARILRDLPSPFAESLYTINLSVEETADANTARQLCVDDRMRVQGLYRGLPLIDRSFSLSGQRARYPERIILYRQPILAQWQSTPNSLEQIITHIVIHEVGHHFGFSDDDMNALEDGEE